MEHFIINLDEIWLKGRNRPHFMKKLMKHIFHALHNHDLNSLQIVEQKQKIVLQSQQSLADHYPAIFQTLKKIPGIYSFQVSKATGLNMDSLSQVALNLVESTLSKDPEKTVYQTFKVLTKRANKKFPLNSMEVSREVGHLILKKFPQLKVTMKNPDLAVEIIITNRKVYVSQEKYFGMGGLPIETSGHMITLLSGGFDSPVASHLMAKRGTHQTFVFFHAYPFVGDEVKEKIIKLFKYLSPSFMDPKLYIIPFGVIQKKIATFARADYRTLFFRCYMLKVAELLCQKVGAQGIITGDALGQVSSQTLENILVQNQIVQTPIFRPLIAMNKKDILKLSEDIQTHNISLIPHDDACSLFSVKHPVTKPYENCWRYPMEENPLTEELHLALEQAEIL